VGAEVALAARPGESWAGSGRPAPGAGEALDSWLEAYAHLLHVTVRDIFAFADMDWDRVNGGQRTSKPWLHQLDEPDLAALGAVTGVAPETPAA
jgi:hypothetical protein